MRDITTRYHREREHLALRAGVVLGFRQVSIEDCEVKVHARSTEVLEQWRRNESGGPMQKIKVMLDDRVPPGEMWIMDEGEYQVVRHRSYGAIMEWLREPSLITKIVNIGTEGAGAKADSPTT